MTGTGPVQQKGIADIKTQKPQTFGLIYRHRFRATAALAMEALR